LILAALAITSTFCLAKAIPGNFNTGWAAYQKGNYAQAIGIWTRLAKQGHESAQINLGFMYDYGQGVTQSFPQAARWYRAAAIQHSAVGQYNLALLISEGKVNPLKGRSAQYWLKKSSAQGYKNALRQLENENANDASASLGSQGRHSNFRETKAYINEASVSVGTAWPIAAGYAVTNHHVVDGKQAVTLVNRAGHEITADVIASDKENDIAFLRVNNPSELPPALPLTRKLPSLGTSVFTIGFPRIDIMGKTPKLSQGIISGINGLRDDPTSYQISVPIQPGNSGGPLLNMKGEVVGMITAMLGSIADDDGEAQPIPNINYALKVEIIKQFLTQVPRPSPDIDELKPSASGLEGLAAKIQDSVLIVMAE
jgi:S1-C subfamily serine protease